jgi:hypothetical protein|nr:MAG TPA: hypothetical protein [Caudoviricetes sp.]
MALYDYKGNDLTKKLITGKMSYEDWEKLITRQMEEAIYKEVKEKLEQGPLGVEISFLWDEDGEFEHNGYYNSIDDAIEALFKYKYKI